MRKIRIAQVGVGHDHADVILKSLLKQEDVFEVAGYYLPEEEQEKFAERLEMECFQQVPRLSLKEILEDYSIEAVAIESEECRLTKLAIQCAEAGKHVHMDKPGGFELQEFAELVSITKENNLTFHLGYMYRYNPAVAQAIADVKAGKLGEIFSVEAHMSTCYQTEKRQWLDGFPGGMMFFLGCHLLDLIYTIQGEPEEIIPYNGSIGADGVTSKDYGMVVLKYKNGISFAKTCALEHGAFDRRQLVISGTKGTIELRPLEKFPDYPNEGYTGVRRVSDRGKTVSIGESERFGRYDAMMKSFAQMVCGEKQNPWSYEYELKLYQFLLKCCEEK